MHSNTFSFGVKIILYHHDKLQTVTQAFIKFSVVAKIIKLFAWMKYIKFCVINISCLLNKVCYLGSNYVWIEIEVGSWITCVHIYRYLLSLVCYYRAPSKIKHLSWLKFLIPINNHLRKILKSLANIYAIDTIVC